MPEAGVGYIVVAELRGDFYAEICVDSGLFLTQRARPRAYHRIFSPVQTFRERGHPIELESRSLRTTVQGLWQTSAALRARRWALGRSR